MTPQDFRDLRAKMGLSARQMGLALGYSTDPGRYVRRFESGESPVPGPVEMLCRYIVRHGLDKTARKRVGEPKRTTSDYIEKNAR